MLYPLMVLLLSAAGIAVCFEGEIKTPFSCARFHSALDADAIALKSMPCHSCACQNNTVTCKQHTCHNQLPADCHSVEGGSSHCCPSCKRCRVTVRAGHRTETRVLLHGEVWSHMWQPCRMFACSGGVVTEFRRVCHPQCQREYQVFLTDACCPRCFGCYTPGTSGAQLAVGQKVRPFADQSIACTCEGDMSLCYKDACPVPHCSLQKQVQDGVCAKCAERQPAKSVPIAAATELATAGHCEFQGSTKPPGAVWNVDSCTNCTCSEALVQCKRRNCPALECKETQHLPEVDQCCPVCATSTDCVDPVGRRYAHNAEWQADKCSRCKCLSGQISCSGPDCPARRNGCPIGQQLQHRAGDCCPSCVSRISSCSTISSQLLRTFDAKTIAFSRRCRYVLMQHCAKGKREFAIRLTPKRRRFALQIRTRRERLSVKVGFQLRINGRRVSASRLRAESRFLSATITGTSIHIVMLNFIHVYWDGDSHLQIKAPQSLSNQVCGLCGNLNGRPNDDTLGRSGELLRSVKDFTREWREGYCRADHKRRSNCLLSVKQQYWVRRYCKKMLQLPCGIMLNLRPYYNWCKEEMCKCQGNVQKCICPVLRKVIRRCIRTRLPVIHLTDFPCSGRRLCPRGFQLSNCSCPVECSTLQQVRYGYTTCPRRCERSCKCRGNRTLLRGRCVTQQQCNRLSRAVDPRLLLQQPRLLQGDVEPI